MSEDEKRMKEREILNKLCSEDDVFFYCIDRTGKEDGDNDCSQMNRKESNKPREINQKMQMSKNEQYFRKQIRLDRICQEYARFREVRGTLI